MKKLLSIILLLYTINQIYAFDSWRPKEIEFITRIDMVQNLSPKGCIVKIFYYYKIGVRDRITNFTKKTEVEIWRLKTEKVYSNESYDVADGQPIWQITKGTGNTHPFYSMGLYKYTDIKGTRTLRKFTIKKAVFVKYKKELIKKEINNQRKEPTK